MQFDGVDDRCDAKETETELECILKVTFIPKALSGAEARLIRDKQLDRLNSRLEQRFREKVILPEVLQYLWKEI